MLLLLLLLYYLSCGLAVEESGSLMVVRFLCNLWQIEAMRAQIFQQSTMGIAGFACCLSSPEVHGMVRERERERESNLLISKYSNMVVIILFFSLKALFVLEVPLFV